MLLTPLLLAGLLGTAPALPVEPAELLTLTPEMADFLAEHVPLQQDRLARVHALMDAIFSRRGLSLEYGNQRTKTAVETFVERSGNCLSFTLLFVALARHVGLDVSFQEVAEVTSWDRRGEVIFNNQHMYAEVVVEGGVIQVDFLPGTLKRYRQVRRIGDVRALAHYLNNLGAEQLADGHAAAALRLFERSLSVDATFVPAEVNRGVALRRLGDLSAAEESYRRALEDIPDEPTALTNLASLYLAQGRRKEAQPLLKRVEAHRARNPFHHLRLGLGALSSGANEEAIKHLRQAIRLRPEDPELITTLAEAQARTGLWIRARSSLQRARQLARADPAEEARLAVRFRELEILIQKNQ